MNDIRVVNVEPDFDVEKKVIEDYEKELRMEYNAQFNKYKRNTGIKYQYMLEYFMENKSNIDNATEEAKQLYNELLQMLNDYFGDL